MVSIGTLVGYLVLEDKLSPALKIAQANVSTAAKSLDKLGESTEKAGRAMLPISAAIGLAGAAVFKFGKDFEKTLTQINTLAGGSAEQVESYKVAIMGMVSEVGKSPQELAEALYFITSSGQSGAAALDTLRVSAKASALGLGETKTVADAATSALNAYGAENLTAEEAVRVLVATVREGKGEADAIAGSLGRVIPIASEMGVKFQDLGAFIAATTKIGLSAEEAATALRGALTTISAPTKEQTDAFADLAERGLLPLGFSLEDVRKKIKNEGLAEGFMQLTEATKGNSEALTAIIGNVRAATGVLGAYGRQGQTTLEVQKKMRTDLKEVEEGFKTLSETVDFKWNKLLSGLQANASNAFAAMRGSFVGFIDGGIKVTEKIDDLIEGFAKLPVPVQQTGLTIAGVLASVGPALLGIGAATKVARVGMDLLSTGLGTASKGIDLLRGGITTASGLMTTFAKTSGIVFDGTKLLSETGFVAGIKAVGVELATLFPKLTLLAKGVGVVGAAFAGWEAGKWISDLKFFGDEQMSVGESFSFGLLKIQQWAGFLDATDADIENSILAQRNLGKENITTAGTFDIASLTIKGYQQSVAEMASPTEQAKNLTAQWNDEMAKLQVQVVNLTAEQRTAIQTGLAMEKNTADIATGLGIGGAAVKAYAAGFEQANQKVDEFLENQRKSVEETRKLGEELAQATVQQTGTDQEARLAAIDQWFANEVAAITGVGEQYKKHYAALEAMREQRKAAETSNIAEINDQSLQALEQRAAKERQTHQDMLSSGLTFNRDVWDAQKEKIIAAEDALRNYSSGFKQLGDEGEKATKKVVTVFDILGESVQATLDRVKGVEEGIKKIESFTMDISPLTKTQRDAVNAQNAMSYELQNDPNAGLRKKLAQLEQMEGTYTPKSGREYQEMINAQILLSQLRQMDLGSPAAQEPLSQRVTQSNMQVVGGIQTESTRAVSGSGAAVGIAAGIGVMNNYINGTGEQVARIIQDQLMGQLRVGRQFGAA